MNQEQDKRMHSTDPMDHATAFAETFADRRVVTYDSLDPAGVDPGTVVGWFANAMTVGERKGHEDAVREYTQQHYGDDLQGRMDQPFFDYDEHEGKPSTGALKLVFLIALGNFLGWVPLFLAVWLALPSR